MKDLDDLKFVFVSGPVSSDPMGQIPKAVRTWDQLFGEGYIPILPQLSVFQQMISPREYEEWMTYFDALIYRCDVLYRLEGASEGADREVERAKEFGIEIWFEDGTESIPANYPRPDVPAEELRRIIDEVAPIDDERVPSIPGYPRLS